MLEKLRLKLAGVDSGLLRLSLLGMLCGVLAGIVIIAFRLLVEWAQGLFLPAGQVENYEALGLGWIFLLPLLGGVALGLVFQCLPPEQRQVGVVHSMERLAYHQGRLPLANMVVQFFGAAVSIVAGHSVGREGPSVHLGAASGSLLGSRLGLPDNAVRSLLACGVAAAIAASFNTPLAGVIFAMEVILLEYSISGFIPVILAAVMATGLSQMVFGSDPAFVVPSLNTGSASELPWALVCGLVIGLLASLFIHGLRYFAGLGRHWPVWLRLSLAGLATALVAMAVPEVMGIGYDTVSLALLGQLGFTMLLVLVGAKLLATTAGLGLGLPGGLIGPTLFIGAVAGGALGLVGETLGMVATADGFYVLLGMGAMMGATLQAPLAALIAMMELTHNPNVILPGMLAIVSGALVVSEGFRLPSVYVVLLRERGLDYDASLLQQTLRRVGVAEAMDRALVVLPRHSRREQIEQKLARRPRWVVVLEQGEPRHALPAVDVQQALVQAHAEDYDLLEIPALRRELVAVDVRANLEEARALLLERPEAMLYVRDGQGGIYGILEFDTIEAYRV